MGKNLQQKMIRLGMGVLALSMGFAPAWASTSYNNSADRFMRQLNYYVDQDRALINAMSSRQSDISDHSDRQIIANYYNDIRKVYVMQNVDRLLSSDPASALEKFTQTINGSFGTSGSNRVNSEELERIGSEIDDIQSRLNQRNIADDVHAQLTQDLIALRAKKRDAEAASREHSYNREFNACVRDKMNLTRLNENARIMRGSLDRLSEDMKGSTLRFDSINATAGNYWNQSRAMQNALRDFDVSPESTVRPCCVEHEIENCQSKIDILVNAKSRLGDDLMPGDLKLDARYVPNPLEVSELSGEDLVDIIQEKRSTLSSLRMGQETDDYVDEQDVFESMARCRIRAKQFQDTRTPMSKTVVNAVGKTLKCAVLPAVATQKWKTGTAKIAFAVGAVPLQVKDFDFSCDPNEMLAWNQVMEQGRDPLAWGIPQMANPPYIASLRQIPPVTTGLPGRGLSADEYLLMTPTPGLDNFSVASNDLRTSARPANSSSGVSLGGRGGTLSSKATRSNSAAIDRGQDLTQAVRSSSSNIRNNNQPDYFASRMLMGSKSTSGFLATGVSRSRIISSKDAQASRSQTASRARQTVLRSVGTTASRSTSEGILGDLDKTTSNLGSVNTVGQQNAQVREEVKGNIQKYLNNIESTRSKAEQTRLSIASLVADYDAKVEELTLEIQDLPPKQIAEKIAAKRSEMFQITKNLGIKKAEYDAYQAAVMEQNSALMRLSTFGPQNLSTTIGGRGAVSTGKTSSSRVSGVDTSGMPNGRGNVQNTSFYDKPISPVDRFWAMLNPLPQAYAVDIKAKEAFEKFWNSEWRRFVGQYGDYVAGRRKVDRANAVEAAQLVAAHKKQITPESYSFIDQGTLLTIDMYLSELEQETAFLIEGNTTEQFRLTPSVLNRVQEARAESSKARESWILAQKEHLKIIPKSYEDDPDLWMGFLPQIFIE